MAVNFPLNAFLTRVFYRKIHPSLGDERDVASGFGPSLVPSRASIGLVS